MPSVRNGETGSRKRDWSVHFLGRGPQGQVTMEWEGWSGLRAAARCWAQRSWSWSSTGRILDSEWRWLEEALLWAPRQILRAEFWTLWIFGHWKGICLGTRHELHKW